MHGTRTWPSCWATKWNPAASLPPVWPRGWTAPTTATPHRDTRRSHRRGQRRRRRLSHRSARQRLRSWRQRTCLDAVAQSIVGITVRFGSEAAVARTEWVESDHRWAVAPVCIANAEPGGRHVPVRRLASPTAGNGSIRGRAARHSELDTGNRTSRGEIRLEAAVEVH